jgi:hypothetical protein
MKDVAEAIAEKYYDAWQKLLFARISFSKTSLAAKVWKDLAPRDRAEFIEAARVLLVDKELMEAIRSRE